MYIFFITIFLVIFHVVHSLWFKGNSYWFFLSLARFTSINLMWFSGLMLQRIFFSFWEHAPTIFRDKIHFIICRVPFLIWSPRSEFCVIWGSLRYWSPTMTERKGSESRMPCKFDKVRIFLWFFSVVDRCSFLNNMFFFGLVSKLFDFLASTPSVEKLPNNFERKRS